MWLIQLLWRRAAPCRKAGVAPGDALPNGRQFTAGCQSLAAPSPPNGLARTVWRRRVLAGRVCGLGACLYPRKSPSDRAAGAMPSPPLRDPLIPLPAGGRQSAPTRGEGWLCISRGLSTIRRSSIESSAAATASCVRVDIEPSLPNLPTNGRGAPSVAPILDQLATRPRLPGVASDQSAGRSRAVSQSRRRCRLLVSVLRHSSNEGRLRARRPARQSGGTSTSSIR